MIPGKKVINLVIFTWINAIVFIGTIQPVFAGETSPPAWSSDMLKDSSVWPHNKKDARIKVTENGLHVEVASGRKYVIAAASRLLPPKNFGRIKIGVYEVGGGGRWFVRLYGDLRQRGDHRTFSIAEDESSTGERVFDIDFRILHIPGALLQLQLGVEGKPGAYAVFNNVSFLPSIFRANRTRQTSTQPGQIDIAAVEHMPNLPEPFKCIDWKAKAIEYDRFVFDFGAQGNFLPLVWLDKSHINTPFDTFGLPSYVGDPNRSRIFSGRQEGITCMGAVLGATLVGINKSKQDHDYVRMCRAWFNSRNSLNLVLNLQNQETGGSFWYEIWPHIVFYALSDKYPEKPEFKKIVRITADRWRKACLDLAGSDNIPDFNHTAFNFRTRKPVDNGRWKEPDAAAGVAWLQYAAWKQFGEKKYLTASEGCLKFLTRFRKNPYYEILLPFGTLVAARANAELGRTYDIDRFLNWCFGISDYRGGWGVTVGNWGGYDCDGLIGSIDNRGGYAFAMNTFAQAAALVPLVRYEAGYARAIGKWMLNLANSARLFYAGNLPPGHQTSGSWKGDPQHVIAYEGLRREWHGKSPCATGDPVAMNWGPKTDLGLYGSGYVGMLGAIVRQTDVSFILQIDCCATDFFHDKAYPTYLYFNPKNSVKKVTLELGNELCDIYETTSHRFIKRAVRDKTIISIPADSAIIVVLVPSKGAFEIRGKKALVNGIVLDFAVDK